MNSKENHIDDLIASCKQNNQKAQFEIYNRYAKAMYNVAHRIVKDSHYAEDVMQESFLKAFTKIDDYKQEVAFGAWLKRIVVNRSIDFLKKNNVFKTEDFENTIFKLEDQTENCVDIAEFKELKVKQIIDCIGTLKYNYQVVLSLHFIEGYDQEEISEILNISYANVRTTLSRAKENLRKKLEEL
ncbi:RNA polymerase sigma factor [Flavobacterium sp. K77]|uniref:RNA polymerase sigma factor n=1 Tax=Flavobacterium turcicum TaxID=2764718 RepID=A0ABR7JJ63_9FLAO|nr:MULTISPECIES: RNA polymerase sigma factor [Flavobacterium]MBC5864538.1 RNA polymerase sigma factor [Flavobacterium turcicum]MCF6141096.1 RNA polymerase sigma factor [Flavobacterium sp. K77]NHL03325.1 RNA polymerase sigma factor [Flavobacterium turcicum]